MKTKTCQWDQCECRQPPVAGERYCPKHRWKMLRRMERDGFLTRVPPLPWDGGGATTTDDAPDVATTTGEIFLEGLNSAEL